MATKKSMSQLRALYGRRIHVGAWKIGMMEDIEVYDGEMLPHSPYGDRFKHEANDGEKALFLREYAKLWEG